jgi:hypothetical protein
MDYCFTFEEARKFIEARNGEYYRLGDKAVVVSLKEIIDVEDTEVDDLEYSIGPPFVGRIVSIECNSNDMPRNVEFLSQIYIKVKYPGSVQDEIKPHSVTVPHTDIINCTVLGRTVSWKLHDATRDRPLGDDVSNSRHIWPMEYGLNAMSKAASSDDYEKLYKLQNKVRAGCFSALREMELHFQILNRELRFMVLQDLFNNTCTFYDFEAKFYETNYDSKRYDYKTVRPINNASLDCDSDSD